MLIILRAARLKYLEMQKQKNENLAKRTTVIIAAFVSLLGINSISHSQCLNVAPEPSASLAIPVKIKQIVSHIAELRNDSVKLL